MDISQFESSNNNAILQIQRAQRVLDQTELKMRRFKKEKESASKVTSFEYRATPLPDIKQYLSYLIQNNQQPQPKFNSEYKNPKKLQSTAEIKNNNLRSLNNLDSDIQNIKRTQKPDRSKTNQNALDDKTIQYQNVNFLNIQKHTQEQLEKSQNVRLQRIQTMYKQQFQHLDRKIDELYKNRDQIKVHKVLLLRNNEQIQHKIHQFRIKRNSQEGQNHGNAIVDELRSQLLKLQKKLAKIQMQNSRIIKKKQQLQANMRVCIRNSKQQLQQQLTSLRKNKSKSSINYKCPYH